MRLTVFAILTVFTLAASTGCASLQGIIYGHDHGTDYTTYDEFDHSSHEAETAFAESGHGVEHASFSGPGGCANCGKALPPPGPPTGAVTYPYYTTRGPRDFLSGNPPSIGR